MYTNEIVGLANMKKLALSVIFLGLFLGSKAFAHASEQGFVLLLPTELYIAGGTASVALSILLISRISGAGAAALFRPITLVRLRNRRDQSAVTSLLSSLVFLALIFVGLAGPNDPQNNLLPLTIWTVWWVGLVVLQGILGDIWRWINPWTGLSKLISGEQPAPLRLPEWLGIWPAVALLLTFNLFAVADIAPSDPDRLVRIALGYWAFTFAGIMVFGAKPWLSRVECFSVFLNLIAGLAPIRMVNDEVRLGFPGWALLATPQMDASKAVFCLVLLASGSFDGLHETFWWLAQIGVNPLEFPGRSAVVGPSSLGLLLTNALLIVIFSLAVAFGHILTPQPRNAEVSKAVVRFSLAIIPIAFGYHFAHFLTSFLVQVQYAVVAFADPLARGWNFFGLAGTPIKTGFFNDQAAVRLIWLAQAFAVVGSHILSVIMAHQIAHDIHNDDRAAVRAQIGIGILMVFYTIFGLWLLASPRGV